MWKAKIDNAIVTATGQVEVIITFYKGKASKPTKEIKEKFVFDIYPGDAPIGQLCLNRIKAFEAAEESVGKIEIGKEIDLAQAQKDIDTAKNEKEAEVKVKRTEQKVYKRTFIYSEGDEHTVTVTEDELTSPTMLNDQYGEAYGITKAANKNAKLVEVRDTVEFVKL